MLGIVLSFSIACVAKEDIKDASNFQTNFDALWQILNDNYCYFEEKNIDWDSIYVVYNKRLNEQKYDNVQFFDFLTEMIRELKDGHTNLISSFDNGRYTWSNPDGITSINYSLRAKYIGKNYRISRGMVYDTIKSINAPDDYPQDIGFIIYNNFMNSIGDMKFLEFYFSKCKGVIIDLRDNGGGLVDNADLLLSYFLKKRTLVGYSKYKLSPARNDFSTPKPLYIDPIKKTKSFWNSIPIVVLQDAGSYSATNDFLYKSFYEDNITTVGTKSGGGAGMPSVMELPNGWRIRFSTAASYDRNMISFENGTPPEVYVSIKKETPGDDLIEKAIEIIYEQTQSL